MEAEGRHLWRPKADFKGGVPPHGHLGGCGEAVAPPQKELFAIAKSGTLVKAAKALMANFPLNVPVDWGVNKVAAFTRQYN